VRISEILPSCSDHAADQLDIEMPHAEGAFRRLARQRKGLRQDLVERLAGGDLGLQLRGPRLHRGPVERRDLLFQRVDLLDVLAVGLEHPLVAAAENPCEQIAHY
jgi:hypothetical protein